MFHEEKLSVVPEVGWAVVRYCVACNAGNVDPRVLGAARKGDSVKRMSDIHVMITEKIIHTD